jgi:phosphatidate cytidylyltransferase
VYEEGITVVGSASLPHWSDPPTGEVPAVLMSEGGWGDGDPEGRGASSGAGARWRDGEGGWDDLDEIAELAGDETPQGVLDQSRAEHSDLYSFDEDFERVTSRGPEPGEAAHEDERSEEVDDEEWVAAATVGAARASRGATRSESQATPAGRTTSRRMASASGGDGDMTSRVAVGAGLLVLLIVAYIIGSKALLVLTAAVVLAAVAEGYGMLQRAGFRPATLLALAGTAGLVFGAYWKGLAAIPIVLVLTFAGSMTWYILGIVEARPLANVAVTIMVFVWVAVLGSFAAVMLRAAHGKGLFLGAVIVAVVADVSAFLVGRSIGSRPLAESVSPNKTLEGFIGGVVGALVAGAVVGKAVTPWGGMKHGLVLGLIIGLVAPLGDLFESMIKRDLGVKDFGSTLAGHGGVLDRFDSMLLALPAAYFVATTFHLVRP